MIVTVTTDSMGQITVKENIFRRCSNSLIVKHHASYCCSFGAGMLLRSCLKFNQMQIRQAASGWVSVRDFIWSSEIPSSLFGHHLCLRLSYCANQNSLYPSGGSVDLICPSLRDASLISLSGALVYISRGKKK